MPRPDIASLGIKYRRIPILSIGRDVYLDTRLILQKLETLPAANNDNNNNNRLPKLGAADGEHRAIERLLAVLNIEAGGLAWAMSLMPPTLPIFTDPTWIKDRSDFVAAGGGPQKIRPPSPAARAEAIANVRGVLDLLETSLLADGRDWVLDQTTTTTTTKGPSLADIEAVWLLHWLQGIPGTFPADQLSKTQFPKVFAWIERFDRAVSAAAKQLGKVPRLSGEEAAKTIVGSSYFDEEDGQVQEDEPIVQVLGLKPGDRVVVYPTDTGSTHKDSGNLVSLDDKEVVFETKADLPGSPSVRVHAPRHGFRIAREDQTPRL